MFSTHTHTLVNWHQLVDNRENVLTTCDLINQMCLCTMFGLHGVALRATETSIRIYMLYECFVFGKGWAVSNMFVICMSIYTNVWEVSYPLFCSFCKLCTTSVHIQLSMVVIDVQYAHKCLHLLFLHAHAVA